MGIHNAERGLFDLMRGQPLYVIGSESEGGSVVLAAAVEGLSASVIERLRQADSGRLRLAVTNSRARAMGLATNGRIPQNGRIPGPSIRRTSDPSPVCLELPTDANAQRILRLSTAVGKYGSDAVRLDGASEVEASALTLARIGRLLPAVVCAAVPRERLPPPRETEEDSAILRVSTSEVQALSSGSGLEVTRVTEAPVPLEEAEDARVVLFREAGGLFEHVAILIGEPESWPDPVPARLHSACLTGDLFGSLKCDCGEQLRGSLRVFAERGGGVLLYLAQEGRGIGLGNKLRAYALQEAGLDTVDADCTLGFGADERSYEVAVQMLRNLGIERVQLLTNNPEKVGALQRGGIDVVEREPLHGTLNRHNLPYMQAKVRRAGHWLEDMLETKVRR